MDRDKVVEALGDSIRGNDYVIDNVIKLVRETKEFARRDELERVVVYLREWRKKTTDAHLTFSEMVDSLTELPTKSKPELSNRKRVFSEDTEKMIDATLQKGEKLKKTLKSQSASELPKELGKHIKYSVIRNGDRINTIIDNQTKIIRHLKGKEAKE